MKMNKLKNLIIAALMAALCCAATMVIQIPSANGYVNLGDGVVLYCAYTLPPVYGAAAAGIGSALADVLSGYAYYAPGTFVIKAGMAVAAALIFRKLREKHEFAGLAVGAVAAECIMMLGYFGYSALILGNGISAAVSILGNLTQAVMGMAAGIAVYKLMPKKLKETWNKKD